MNRILTTCLTAAAGLLVCTAPVSAALFSATGPIIAILAGELFVGEAEGTINGSGTLAIHSRANAALTCRGQFAKSGDKSGAGRLACSDGATAAFQFQRLSLLRGHGSGNTTRGPMTFTYGLNAEDSEPFLKLPPGKALKLVGKDLELVDRSPVRTSAQDTGAAGMVVEVTPDVLLSIATDTVMSSLRQDRDILKSSPGKFADLVESTILPLFDFPRMTQLALARHWRLASPEQQAALINEFRALLVRTYSGALTSHRNQAIEYKPVRIVGQEKAVTVKSTVKRPGSERLTIDYDMEKTVSGWKIYDVKIAGVSLITTYRSSFSETIVDGGVDGLIRVLAGKNRMAESGVSASDGNTWHILLIYAAIPNIVGNSR